MTSPTFIQLGRIQETEDAISAYASALADWPKERECQVALWCALDALFAAPATFGSLKRALMARDDPRVDIEAQLDHMVCMYAEHAIPYLTPRAAT